MAIPVVMMIPPNGDSPAEKWVDEGRKRAALDLLSRLRSIESAAPIVVLCADPLDQERFAARSDRQLVTSASPFHFGQTLAQIVQDERWKAVAYFGAGSAPLMSLDDLQAAFNQVQDADDEFAIVNNYHSTDWMISNDCSPLEGLAERLPTDNQLGWVLDHESSLRVVGMEPEAASRLDIDTPNDLFLCHRHPNLGGELEEFISNTEPSHRRVIDGIREVLRQPGSQLTLIGRVPSQVWRRLEQSTQIWVRVFSEERGMVASRRMDQGKVASLVAEILNEWGPKRFTEYLSMISDAIIWDTRVWMASNRSWSSKADRFSADLGWVGQIADTQLKELSAAVTDAEIPVLTGGFGIVSGGLYSLLETLEIEDDYQPSR